MIAKISLFLDINPFTKFYVYLKIACLLELDRNNFLKFLKYTKYSSGSQLNKSCFDKKIYRRIRSVLKYLDKESFLIWNKLFKRFDSLEIRENLFSFDEYNNNILRIINPYLASDIAYEETRAKIQKTTIKFITEDALEVKLKEKYDNIWLSNICQYFWSFDKIKELIENMEKYLNDGGQLLISYLYEVSSFEPSKYIETRPIYLLNKLKNKLKEYSLFLSTFIGVNGLIDSSIEERNDSILYYKK